MSINWTGYNTKSRVSPKEIAALINRPIAYVDNRVKRHTRRYKDPLPEPTTYALNMRNRPIIRWKLGDIKDWIIRNYNEPDT